MGVEFGMMVGSVHPDGDPGEEFWANAKEERKETKIRKIDIFPTPLEYHLSVKHFNQNCPMHNQLYATSYIETIMKDYSIPRFFKNKLEKPLYRLKLVIRRFS